MRITYHYDALDRLVEVVWEDGRRIAYVYDAAGNRLAVNSSDAIPVVKADTTESEEAGLSGQSIGY